MTIFDDAKEHTSVLVRDLQPGMTTRYGRVLSVGAPYFDDDEADLTTDVVVARHTGGRETYSWWSNHTIMIVADDIPAIFRKEAD